MQVSLASPTSLAPISPELESNTTKLFTLMDANGNGYVVLRELQRHLSMAGIHLAKDRLKQLYDLIRGADSKSNKQPGSERENGNIKGSGVGHLYYFSRHRVNGAWLEKVVPRKTIPSKIKQMIQMKK